MSSLRRYTMASALESDLTIWCEGLRSSMRQAKLDITEVASYMLPHTSLHLLIPHMRRVQSTLLTVSNSQSHIPEVAPTCTRASLTGMVGRKSVIIISRKPCSNIQAACSVCQHSHTHIMGLCMWQNISSSSLSRPCNHSSSHEPPYIMCSNIMHKPRFVLPDQSIKCVLIWLYPEPQMLL